MKTLAFCIIATMASVCTYGQEDTTATNTPQGPVEISTSDTTRIELKNSYITIIKKNPGSTYVIESDDDDKEHIGRADREDLTWWTGIDIGVNGMLGENYRTELPDEIGYLEPEYGKSRYIALNVLQYRARIVGDYVGLTTGLGIQWYSWKYSGDNSLQLSADTLFAVPSGDRNVTKSKLRATYLAVPLLLEFNTSDNPAKSFHISTGVVGKLRLENMYKEKYSFEGDEYKQSIKGALGMNTWQADAFVKVGYRNVSLFGQFGLTPLFDSQNAANEDIYSFAVGLSFSFNDID